MQKGRFGIRLSFYTVSAFLLAYLGYSTVLFMLAGVVIFLEKDEWAGRQVIQAICLCLIENLCRSVLGIFDPIRSIPIVGAIWGSTIGVITSVLSLLVLIFCIVGIANNLKGKDAGIIGASKFANWAYDVVSKVA